MYDIFLSCMINVDHGLYHDPYLEIRRRQNWAKKVPLEEATEQTGRHCYCHHNNDDGYHQYHQNHHHHLEEAKEKSVNSDRVDGEAGGGDNVGADLAHCFFFILFIQITMKDIIYS